MSLLLHIQKADNQKQPNLFVHPVGPAHSPTRAFFIEPPHPSIAPRRRVQTSKSLEEWSPALRHRSFEGLSHGLQPGRPLPRPLRRRRKYPPCVPVLRIRRRLHRRRRGGRLLHVPHVLCRPHHAGNCRRPQRLPSHRQRLRPPRRHPARPLRARRRGVGGARGFGGAGALALREGTPGHPVAAAGGAGGAAPGRRARVWHRGTVWVRWVAAAKVFDDMWARQMIAEHDAAGREKRSGCGGEPSTPPLFRYCHLKEQNKLHMNLSLVCR
jgi:hypothetical protein